LVAAGRVGEHQALPSPVFAGDDDLGLVGVGGRGRGRVDRHHHSINDGALCARAASMVQRIHSAPVVEELNLDLLAAKAVSEASQPEGKPLNRIPPQSLSRADLDDRQRFGSAECPRVFDPPRRRFRQFRTVLSDRSGFVNR
jgi:hypothetical protein